MPNSSQQELQVFISSTFLELQAEHLAALKSVLNSGHRPTGLGQFASEQGAAFPLVTIQQWIDASDIYVLILGNRYGTVEPESGKSYAHLEYNYAVNKGKPIIAFLIADDATQHWDEQTGRDTAEGQDVALLQEFRSQVQTPHYWTEAKDIQQVLISQLPEFAQHIHEANQTVHQAVPTLRNTDAINITLHTLQVFAQAIQDAAFAAQEAQYRTDRAVELALEGEASAQGVVTELTHLRTIVAGSARTAKRLAESTQQLSKLVTLVTQIASRTNVIALNANIELSRMGHRGAEFASVAAEMRQLANHTAKASKAVEKIVQPIQEKTNTVMTALAEGVQSAIANTQPAQQTQTTLLQLSQLSEQLSQLMHMVSQATAEHTDVSNCVLAILNSSIMDDLPSPSQINQSLSTLTREQPPR